MKHVGKIGENTGENIVHKGWKPFLSIPVGLKKKDKVLVTRSQSEKAAWQKNCGPGLKPARCDPMGRELGQYRLSKVSHLLPVNLTG